MPRRLLAGLLLFAFALPAVLSAEPAPRWIWGAATVPNELRFFRLELNLPAAPRRAVLTFACDDQAVASVNDQAVGRNEDWHAPARVDVTRNLRPGANSIGIVARNQRDEAGLIGQLELTLADGTVQTITTDGRWQTSADGATWTAVRDLGPHGMAPWGEIIKGPTATPVSAIKMLPGFTVELLHSATTSQGSWVSLAFDPKGRLWISPQGPEPLQRLTLKDGRVGAIEPVPTPARSAMGLHWAFDSLYLNGRGTNGLAIYRLRDINGDDLFDTCEPIRTWPGPGGEHGPHGVVSDGAHLYVINGNYVDVPPEVVRTSPFRGMANDLVLPPLEDPGTGPGRRPPGGHILRMSPDGSNTELFAAGQRNAYDLAFNEDGELFTVDSDHEADWGLPWYRPNRVLHCIPGADHGFRDGLGKWPSYYPDSLPAVVGIGLGSPTAITSGRMARFPEKYRRALYAMDWSFGRILAIHLHPEGASYGADYEPILQGRPLNLTDMEVGPDGALYFITGGRGIQSGLYRISYTGTGTLGSAPAPGTSPARDARRQLEQLARTGTLGSLDRIWPSLESPDRTLRYAARLALERQPIDGWRPRALAETNATSGLTALLALARNGTTADQAELLKALARWPLDSLDDERFLLKLRVIEVSVARHGLPDDTLRKLAIDKLGRQFPSRSWPLNRELSQLLVAFGDPSVVAKALDLRDRAPTQQEAIHYQTILRLAQQGWTLPLRQRYFGWFRTGPRLVHPDDFVRAFAEVGMKPSTGAGFDGAIRLVRQQALARLSDAEKGELAAWINGTAVAGTAPPAPAAAPRAGRATVKAWTVAELQPKLRSGDADPRLGRSVYQDAGCAACHRLGGEGGALGPDLSAVGAKYQRIDLLRSLLEPSAVVSELYQATLLELEGGDSVTGRVVEEAPDTLTVLVDPLSGRTTSVPKGRVKKREAARMSPMPEGLLDTFTEREVLSLVEYLAKPVSN